MLTMVLSTVIKIPELRTLVLRVPLPKIIPMGEKPLLRTRFFLIPASTSNGCIKFMVMDGIKQGG